MDTDENTQVHHLLYQLQCNAVRETIERLQNAARDEANKCLIPFGHKVYSQNEEDGIIREIFTRIGTSNKLFVEFGVGNGLENNSLALLFDGWSGLWIEGSSGACQHIQEQLPTVIESGRLTLVNAFINKDNINELIQPAINDAIIDLLSVDIDGNDYHIFEAINCVKARVLVIEYNAKFAPPLAYCMAYDADFSWQGDDGFGASLKFLEVELEKQGYTLVACNLTGTNAFFVASELIGDHFLSPYTAENHYQPARYELTSFPSGHRAALSTLEKSLQWQNDPDNRRMR